MQRIKEDVPRSDLVHCNKIAKSAQYIFRQRKRDDATGTKRKPITPWHQQGFTLKACSLNMSFGVNVKTGLLVGQNTS